MTKGFYRVLIFLFLVVCPGIETVDLIMPARMVDGIEADLKANLVLATITISLLLQPISAVGLWRERLWGVWTLLAAWVFGLFISPVAFSPLIMLVATFVRFSEAKTEHRKTSQS